MAAMVPFKRHQVAVQQFIDQLNGKWNVEQKEREKGREKTKWLCVTIGSWTHKSNVIIAPAEPIVWAVVFTTFHIQF